MMPFVSLIRWLYLVKLIFVLVTKICEVNRIVEWRGFEGFYGQFSKFLFIKRTGSKFEISISDFIFGLKGGLYNLLRTLLQFIPWKNGWFFIWFTPFGPDPSLFSGFLLNNPSRNDLAAVVVSKGYFTEWNFIFS